MDISIIIPTYNSETLSSCLRTLKRQKIDVPFEIIVIDDGSSNAIRNRHRRLVKEIELPIEYVENKHAGPAAARNIGIKRAQGAFLIMLGDDIIVSDNFICEHMDAHKDCHNIACLGLTLWDEEIQITDFMKFLAPYGIHFSYHNIKDKTNCGYGFFYTSNLSIGRDWFGENLFDEDFRFPSYEDIELGYRLEQRGLKIIFNEKALAYHRHLFKEKEYFRRRKTVGQQASILIKKHPELKCHFLVKNPIKLTLFKVLARYLFFLRLNKKYRYLYWELKIREIMLKEIYESLK